MKTLLYIGNKLSQKGYTKTSIETLGQFLTYEGYTVITASSKKNKIARIFDMLWHIVRHRNRIDYILIDTYSTNNFYFALASAIVARILHVPYIPILHGGNLPSRLIHYPRLSSVIFNHAYTNVAPSKYLYNQFYKHGYTNLVHIPNSIELTHYRFKHREQLAPKLLWVRSFDKIYNPLLALKVLKSLQAIYNNAEMAMVGPDKDGTLEKCKAYANTHYLNVIFTGKLSKPEWITLSSTYSIFINTTNFDNTPVSVIEAMALGLPVISTNVGGMPFLIDDYKNGVLVPKDDKAAMLQAILNLLEQPKLVSKLSISARHKVEDYDWTSIKDKWKSLLS